jgi:hypothetical protein
MSIVTIVLVSIDLASQKDPLMEASDAFMIASAAIQILAIASVWVITFFAEGTAIGGSGKIHSILTREARNPFADIYSPCVLSIRANCHLGRPHWHRFSYHRRHSLYCLELDARYINPVPFFLVSINPIDTLLRCKLSYL